MAEKPATFDYIVAGGGNCGSVLASRLSQALPKASIALVEAGPDAHDNPLVSISSNVTKLHATALHWNYKTVPQTRLGGRRMNASGGCMLSGSTGVNYGTWVRGHEVDFDDWSAKVCDPRWSYKSLLPYFKRTETHYLLEAETPNAGEHGFNGPINMESPPHLKFSDVLRAAYAHEGVKNIADANSGQPLGIAYRTYNWYKGTREPATQMYDMSRVHILTDTLVHRVVFDTSVSPPRATGVFVSGNRTLTARKEVILTLGALRTPSVLMLSGIGPAAHLVQHDIPLLVDLPVGANLHDHPALMLPMRLKHPERGYALGGPGVADSLVWGEYAITTSLPRAPLLAALHADGVDDPTTHPLARQPRAHIETLPNYLGIALPPGIDDPRDGSLITIGTGAFQPTSRGTVRLASAQPDAHPLIDPAYLTTEFDRMKLREAIRQTLRIADSPTGREEIAGLVLPEGVHLTLNTSDEELDRYIAQHARTWFHSAGTAAMGPRGVVGGNLKVHDVAGLRVADVSILPDPTGAHYQAIAYAIGEQAAVLVAADA